MMLFLTALFLPLFPLSVIQNLILTRLRAPIARCVLLLVWPQIGVMLLEVSQPETSSMLVAWALLSAALYALRMLTVRDLGLWTGFLASSALALTWLPFAQGMAMGELRLFAFWLSVPPALLMLLIGTLTRRLGAAYAGLHEGIAEYLPRLSGVLTVLLLSAIATPPFPGFFVLLNLLHALNVMSALGVLTIWLLWGWAATRVLQGFLAGPGRHVQTVDLGRAGVFAWVVALGGFAIAGLYVVGGTL